MDPKQYITGKCILNDPATLVRALRVLTVVVRKVDKQMTKISARFWLKKSDLSVTFFTEIRFFADSSEDEALLVRYL